MDWTTKIARLLEEQEKYMSAVEDQEKQQDLAGAMAVFRWAREMRESGEELMKWIESEYRAAEMRLVEVMEAAGISSYRDDAWGRTVVLAQQIYPGLAPGTEDREEAMNNLVQWLDSIADDLRSAGRIEEADDVERLVQRRPQANFAAMRRREVLDLLLDAEAPMPEELNLTPRTVVNVRKTNTRSE